MFLSTTVPVAVITTLNSKCKIYYFDDKQFNSKDDIDNYVSDNLSVASLEASATSFFYDGRAFNTSQELRDYLEDKFLIDEHLTKFNPGNYTISSNGELSSDVLIDDNDSYKTVYEGKDGLSYLNREDAEKTYLDYKTGYKVDTRDFYSKEEALSFLRKEKLKKLTESQSDADKKEKMYYNGGLLGTEEEIKDWIKRHTQIGFSYEGKDYSNYNYKEFYDDFQSKVTDTSPIFKNNVREIVDADKSSYWFDLSNKEGMNGFFVGPRFVETAENVPHSLETADFHVIDSFTPDIHMGTAMLAGMGAMIKTGAAANFEAFDWKWSKGSLFMNYLESVLTKDNVNYKTFSEIYERPNSNKLRDLIKLSTNDILKIRNSGGKDFDDFDMFLLISKRIMTAGRVYTSFNPLELELCLKNMLKDILNKTNIKVADVILDYNFWNDTKLEDLIDLFLDPNKFALKNSKLVGMINASQTLFNVYDSVITSLTDLAAGIQGFVDVCQNENKIEKDLDEANSNLDSIKKAISKNRGSKINVLKTISKDVTKAEALVGAKDAVSVAKTDLALSQSNMVIAAITLSWKLRKAAGFISYKTAEYKIDKLNSILYVSPVFKLPFKKFETAKLKVPKVEISEISKSPLGYMLPKYYQDVNNPQTPKVYEYGGKYFLGPEAIRNELLYDIYRHPQLFMASSRIFTDPTAKDIGYKISPKLKNMNYQIEFGQKQIKQSEYDTNIEEEKNAYADYVFKRNFAHNTRFMYTDGFGGSWNTKDLALASYYNNIKNSQNIKKVYVLETHDGKKIYRDHEFEIREFVYQHESSAIKEKNIRGLSLTNTTNFDKLESIDPSMYYTIFSLNYYGDTKYFGTEEQIWKYIYAHENFHESVHQVNIKQYSFKENIFYSKTDLNSWVKENTKENN